MFSPTHDAFINEGGEWEGGKRQQKLSAIREMVGNPRDNDRSGVSERRASSIRGCLSLNCNGAVEADPVTGLDHEALQ